MKGRNSKAPEFARRSTLSRSQHSSEHASTAFAFQDKAAAQLAIALAAANPIVESASQSKLLDRILRRKTGETALAASNVQVDLIDARRFDGDGAEFGNLSTLLTESERSFLPAATVVVDCIAKAAGAWQDASEALEQQKASNG